MKLVKTFCKHVFLVCILAILIGSVSAFFLLILAWATETQQLNQYLLYYLPIAGLFIIHIYRLFGKDIQGGNNLLILSYHDDERPLSWKLAPLIFVSTILTHLFGGSAGREGTAVQMGGSISIQMTRFFDVSKDEKRLILLMGIAAGFASVFGTPWAGFVFAFEFLWAKEKNIGHILLVLLAAFLSHYVCLFWGVKHTQFPFVIFPGFGFPILINCALAGIAFGLTALLFVWVQDKVNLLFSFIANAYLRVLVGGILIVCLVQYFEWFPFVGLGVDGILDSFESPQPGYYFFIKLILTILTLSSGFKGGEVTPLFFIGATLGSALVWIFPLPVSFLAAIGLIAVFASAAQVPLASVIMGAELFGVNGLPYFLLVCFFAFLSSGFKGIYSEHPMGALKRNWFSLLKSHRYFHKQ